MSDAPIEPQEYTYGVKVVDIGDIRVARGMTRRPIGQCSHRHQVYDDKERRVWCSDCETEIEPFDAYMRLVEMMDGHIKKLQAREKQVAEAESHALRSRASKVMDEAWRSLTTAPLCPHCDEAILPGDVARGVAKCSRSLVEAKRKRETK